MISLHFDLQVALLVPWYSSSIIFLETNSYVRCLLVNFSKAFDVIDLSILATKLEQLNLPSCILKWIGSFLTGRSQQVKYLNLISTPKPINRVQVLGLLSILSWKVT